jgi:hypothetical protein
MTLLRGILVTTGVAEPMVRAIEQRIVFDTTEYSVGIYPATISIGLTIAVFEGNQ